MHVTRDFIATSQELLAGGGIAAVLRYAKSLRRTMTFATFAADDPLPALVELPIVAKRVVSRRLSLSRQGTLKPHTVRTRTTM
jgi:predicted ATP-grasp superfamily ATP-dependent carboligase